MSEIANDTARALFEAHVKHELAALGGDAVLRTLAEEVGKAFDWLGTVTLNQIATRAQIVAVIDRYAIQFRIGGGITELAGEMSNAVFSSTRSEETRVDEILPPSLFEEFAEKIVALDSARREAIHLVTQSNAYGAFVTRVLKRGIVDFVFRPLDKAQSGDSLFANLARRVPPTVLRDLEERIAARLERYLEIHRERIAHDSEEYMLEALDERAIRTVADDVWESVAPMRLSDAFAFITSHDLEDFVVLGYEFWLKYRKTRYFRELSTELVGFFFDKYGDGSVADLVSDMGVSREMLVGEIQTFVGPVLAEAVTTGFLESRIRARLAPFYASSGVSKLLSEAGAGDGSG